jgi:hypothetical protein
LNPGPSACGADLIPLHHAIRARFCASWPAKAAFRRNNWHVYPASGQYLNAECVGDPFGAHFVYGGGDRFGCGFGDCLQDCLEDGFRYRFGGPGGTWGRIWGDMPCDTTTTTSDTAHWWAPQHRASVNHTQLAGWRPLGNPDNAQPVSYILRRPPQTTARQRCCNTNICENNNGGTDQGCNIMRC